MVHAPERIAAVHEIAARHSDLTIICDHVGFARETMDGRAMPRMRELLPLAKLPNVYVEVSALPCHSSEPSPFRSLQDPLRTVFDAFGPECSFWGSDITPRSGILFLSAGDAPLHRGIGLPVGRRSGMDHGQGPCSDASVGV